MQRLARIQDLMQRAIVDDHEGQRARLLQDLRPSSLVPTHQMLDVYANAYRSRLAEILSNDLPSVATYLGEELFAHATAGYIAAHPSDVRNARYYSRHAAQFLARAEPFSRWPQVSELAAIELALADAFDAADASPISLEELLATHPDSWERLTFTPHPSLRRIDATTNAFAIWTALQASPDDPPQPRVLDAPEHLLVWRADAGSRLRALPPAEARGLDALFACRTVGEAIAEAQSGPDAVDVGTAVAYLAQWVAAGLLLTA